MIFIWMVFSNICHEFAVMLPVLSEMALNMRVHPLYLMFPAGMNYAHNAKHRLDLISLFFYLNTISFFFFSLALSCSMAFHTPVGK